MGKSPAEKIILSYNDVVLRQSDMDILNGPNYINDQIIEFYFSYLSNHHPDEILMVPPAISFWIANFEDTATLKDFTAPLNFPSRKLVMFPVNDSNDVTVPEGGNHWSLLVYVRDDDVFVHHDSMGRMNHSCAKQLYGKVISFLRLHDSISVSEKPRYIECDVTPQQQNMFDCGLHVLNMARIICEWSTEEKEKAGLWFHLIDAKRTAEPFDVSGMRKEIIELIRGLMPKE